MRLGKMCGLLMKAFLAVLMLFVTAAAVEVYWEDEFDEAIANQCESIILKEEYLNMDFGEAIVVDFDTVLKIRISRSAHNVRKIRSALFFVTTAILCRKKS